MPAWVNKILLPLLLLALAIVVHFEAGSVKSLDLDSGYGGAEASRPKRTRSEAPQGAAVKSRLAAGERFASLNELVNDQQAAGYLKIGYFGKYWPATVSEVKNGRDGIIFVKRDGSKHSYTGFDGYRMRMVRLTGGGERETIVIFRSIEEH